MDVKKTATSIFMVPTLKIDSNQLKDNNFVNAYIRDEGREVQYKDAVYLLFMPHDWNIFQDFVEREYDRTGQIIDDYDYDKGFVVLVYTLNPRYEADFQLIRMGQYSKTSPEFQELFPKVKKIIKNGKYKDEIALQHRIFKKTPDLREYWENKIGTTFKEDMEVWDGFNEENEILNIDKIKELV